jgi:hypothetical protein
VSGPLRPQASLTHGGTSDGKLNVPQGASNMPAKRKLDVPQGASNVPHSF